MEARDWIKNKYPKFYQPGQVQFNKSDHWSTTEIPGEVMDKLTLQVCPVLSTGG